MFLSTILQLFQILISFGVYINEIYIYRQQTECFINEIYIYRQQTECFLA